MVTRRMVVNPPSPRAMVSAASTRRFDRDSPGRHPPQGVRGEPDDRVGPPIRPAAVHDPGGVLPPDRPAAAAAAGDLDVQERAGAGGQVPERIGHGGPERVDSRPGQPVAVYDVRHDVVHPPAGADGGPLPAAGVQVPEQGGELGSFRREQRTGVERRACPALVHVRQSTTRGPWPLARTAAGSAGRTARPASRSAARPGWRPRSPRTGRTGR